MVARRRRGARLPAIGATRTPIAPAGNPALVLLDLKMPKVDGLEVLRAGEVPIRSCKTIPVVMLTSSREEQDLVASYDLGVNAYVVKPVDFHRVRRRRQGARRLLGRRQRAAAGRSEADRRV